MKKLDVNDYGFAHLTVILLLHYLVKCRSRSLAVYNNKFILGSQLSYCFKTVFTADDKQLLNSLRQLKGYSNTVHEGFLKNFCRKIRRAEDLTTCFQTLTNMGLRKSSKQWATAHCMYVWQHGYD